MAKQKRIESKTSKSVPSFRVEAKTEEQKRAIESIVKNKVTFLHGPAGCGKTFLATLLGLQMFMSNRYEGMFFTRPCVEAFGERLGYLPGDANSKLSVYLVPIMDILGESMTQDYIDQLVSSEVFRTIPIAFMRGITIKRSFVVADEMQNSTVEQMRLVLTRFGENSKMVITGDLTQSDLPNRNGLKDAIVRLQGVKDVGIVELTESSIVRDPVVADIDRKYRENK